MNAIATHSYTAADGTMIAEFAGWNGHTAILSALADGQASGQAAYVTLALEETRETASEADMLWNLAETVGAVIGDVTGGAAALHTALDGALLVTREYGADGFVWSVRISHPHRTAHDVTYSVRFR